MTREGQRSAERREPLHNFDGYRDMTPGEYDRFRFLIRDTAGISLSEGKKELLRARLGKVMRKRGIPSFGEYLRMVEEDESGDEITMLLDAISTNLTSFFREADHLTFLSGKALPEVMAARQARSDHRIRAWSAGCSTGEEPYSIAMTLLEHMPGNEEWDIRLLATDLSTRAISTAREGVYSKERLSSVSPFLVKRYFSPEENRDGKRMYAINPAVRRLVSFARLNLLEHYPFKGPFDFIFCRNVMIYFARDTQRVLIDRICRYLADGGYLFVGHSESLNGIQHPLQYIRPSVYRKTGKTR